MRADAPSVLLLRQSLGGAWVVAGQMPAPAAPTRPKAHGAGVRPAQAGGGRGVPRRAHPRSRVASRASPGPRARRRSHCRLRAACGPPPGRPAGGRWPPCGCCPPRPRGCLGKSVSSRVFLSVGRAGHGPWAWVPPAPIFRMSIVYSIPNGRNRGQKMAMRLVWGLVGRPGTCSGAVVTPDGAGRWPVRVLRL